MLYIKLYRNLCPAILFQLAKQYSKVTNTERKMSLLHYILSVFIIYDLKKY